MKRVILTTGGTGGHIFPALAVAEELRRRDPGLNLLFMGSKHGPEADLAVQADIDYVGLPVRGFLGRGIRSLAAAVGMMRGIAKAGSVIDKVKPDLVIGFGGYAAFAGVIAAGRRAIPTAIHEQNNMPGLANRILAKRVDKIFLSLPDERGIFPMAKARLTGNPVRSSIAALAEYEPHRAEDMKRRVLVIGGSQGARAVNQAVTAILPHLLSAGITLWHQTGQADLAAVREAYRKAGAEAMRVDPFIHDMAEAYAWADIAVSRAGATSIAELTVAALPAVFIPFAQATHDHQTHNARQLVTAGAAALLAQSDIAGESGDPEKLAQLLTKLLDEPHTLEKMSAAARNLARPKAASDLVDELELLAESNASGPTGKDNA